MLKLKIDHSRTYGYFGSNQHIFNIAKDIVKEITENNKNLKKVKSKSIRKK